MSVVLVRGPSTDFGTFGDWIVNRKRFCFSLELPDRGNMPQYSCILPPGLFDVVLARSPHFGMVYHVINVKGRSNILIHSGCYAGDVKKGLKTHVLGCLLQGYRKGTMDGQPAIWNSRPAVSDFIKIMGGKPFRLEIVQ